MNTVNVQPARDNGRHIADALVAVATQTAQELEAVWDQVGYAPDEKRKQLESLLAGFHRLCEEKVKEEQGVRDQFHHNILQTIAEIQEISTVLGDQPQELDAGATNFTEQLAHYECRVEELRRRRDKQRLQFAELQGGVVALCETLGEEVEAQFLDLGSDLRTQRLAIFQSKKTELEAAVEARTHTVVELVQLCQALMSQLKLKPSSELDNQILGSLTHTSDQRPVLHSTKRSASSVGLSMQALEELRAKHQELVAEKQRRTDHLERMGEEILKLWAEVGLPQAEQDAFSAGVNGIGMDTLETGEREIERLRVLKQGMMGGLIDRARTQITELWDEMGFTQEERDDFAPYRVGEDGFTDALLQQHQEEAQALAARLDTMRPILERIEEREILVQERFKLETVNKDSTRYNSRDPLVKRELQLELEMEKRVKKRLPALTDKLKLALAAWEQNQNCHFKFNGIRYLDAIKLSEVEFNDLRNQLKAVKDAKKREERDSLIRNGSGGSASALQLSGASTPMMSMAMRRGGATPGTHERKPSSLRKLNLGSSGSLNGSGPFTPSSRAQVGDASVPP